MDTLGFIKANIGEAIQEYTYKVIEMYNLLDTDMAFEDFISIRFSSSYYTDMLDFMFATTYQFKCEQKAWKEVREELSDYLDDNWFTIKDAIAIIGKLIKD